MTSPINLNVNVNQDPQRNIVEVNAETTEVEIALQGIQGSRGYGWISGEGEPTAEDGRIGDFYIDTVANTFWGPKSADGWPELPFYVPGTPQRHIHTQASPSSTWVINHVLDGYPSVMVVDSASTVVIGEVSYVSTSQVVVEFTSPFSGFAYLT
jgi:hypothetical protein